MRSVCFRVVFAALDVHGRQDVGLLPGLKQRTQHMWEAPHRSAPEHQPERTTGPTLIPVRRHARDSPPSPQPTLFCASAPSSHHQASEWRHTKRGTGRLVQREKEAAVSTKGLHYSLLSDTRAKLPVLLFKGKTQNMHIMMLHLKHKESQGEVCFLLFNTGSLLQPQACIYRHSCTCDPSSHCYNNLK